MKILQICHGKIIPEDSSAYSLRCNKLFNISEIVSIGGLVFRDEIYGNKKQYRNYLLMLFSIIKGNRIFEIYLSNGKFVRKRYIHDIIKKVKNSDVIVFEGPWQYPLFKDFLADKIVIYDAHNVEYNLRKNNKYNDMVKKIESELLNNADIIFSITYNGIKEFNRIYNIDENKAYYVPYINKKQYEWHGIDSNTIVFIGSMYYENLRAVDFIKNMATKLPNINFYIIGNIRNFFNKKIRNVIFTGYINEDKKNEIMAGSLMAINPVFNGSGMSFKIFDYISHGIPVISSEAGISGYANMNPENYMVVSSPEKFVENIQILAGDKNKLLEYSRKSSEFYKKVLDTNDYKNPEEIIINFKK